MRFLPFTILALMLAFSPVSAHAAADSKAVAGDVQPTVKSEGGTAPHHTVSGSAAVAHEPDTLHEAVAEHGGGGGLPQLNIGTYPSQVFWLLVMFAVLYTAFSKSLLPAIGAVVQGRENHIKGNLDAAQALRDQAQAIQAAYEKNIDAAKAGAVSAVQDVENAAKKKAGDQLESFRKKSESEIQSAEERVLLVKDKAMGDMSHVAAEVASIAAEKITGINTDVQKAKAIVNSIAEKAKAA